MKPANTLVLIAAAVLTANVSLCRDFTRNIPFNLPAGATSVHWTSTGDLNSDKDVVVRQAGSSTPVPYQYYALGGDTNNSVAWDQPPGAGKYTLTFTATTPIKNVQFWYDYPKKPPNLQGPADQTVASLYIDFGSNFATILADNFVGPDSVTIGPILATVVTGPPDYVNGNWANATGANYTFPGLTIGPGQTADFVGTVPLQSNQWVKVMASIGGAADVSASVPTAAPEPSTAMMLLIALTLFGCGILRKRQITLARAGAR